MKIPVSVVFEEDVLTWLNKKYPNPMRSSFINMLVKTEMTKENLVNSEPDNSTTKQSQPQKARGKK